MIAVRRCARRTRIHFSDFMLLVYACALFLTPGPFRSRPPNDMPRLNDCGIC